jgi:hypothetical protein
VKTIVKTSVLSVLTVLVMAASSRCLALQENADVSQERAKELGVAIRSNAAMPVYDTAAQVKAMPPGKATVEHIETYWSLLSGADGKKFRIGSERGEQEVWHFVGTALQKGQSYDFPGVFLDYQQRKFYVTADEIKAMSPCRATLEVVGPCFSIFRAADGKQFVIGDPGSKPEVWRFLQGLEKGKTYEMPRAFLEYRKKR